MGKLGSPPPTISYMDAARMELIDGVPMCAMSQEAFTSWLDPYICNNAALRAKLEKHDYFFLVDRWSAILAILEAGIPLKVD